MFVWPLDDETMQRQMENPMMGVNRLAEDRVRLKNLAGQVCEFVRRGDTWHPLAEKDWGKLPLPPPPAMPLSVEVEELPPPNIRA